MAFLLSQKRYCKHRKALKMSSCIFTNSTLNGDLLPILHTDDNNSLGSICTIASLTAPVGFVVPDCGHHHWDPPLLDDKWHPKHPKPEKVLRQYHVLAELVLAHGEEEKITSCARSSVDLSMPFGIGLESTDGGLLIKDPRLELHGSTSVPTQPGYNSRLCIVNSCHLGINARPWEVGLAPTK